MVRFCDSICHILDYIERIRSIFLEFIADLYLLRIVVILNLINRLFGFEPFDEIDRYLQRIRIFLNVLESISPVLSMAEIFDCVTLTISANVSCFIPCVLRIARIFITQMGARAAFAP